MGGHYSSHLIIGLYVVKINDGKKYLPLNWHRVQRSTECSINWIYLSKVEVPSNYIALTDFPALVNMQSR